MNLELNSPPTPTPTAVADSTVVDSTEINWEEYAPKISLDSTLWTDDSLINPIETSVMEETPAFNATEFKSGISPNQDKKIDRNNSPFLRHDRSEQIHADLVKSKPHYVQGVIRGDRKSVV